MVQRYGLLHLSTSEKICFLTSVYEHSAFFSTFFVKNGTFFLIFFIKSPLFCSISPQATLVYFYTKKAGIASRDPALLTFHISHFTFYI